MSVKTIAVFIMMVALLACTPSKEKKEALSTQEGSYEIVLNSEVEWTHLNPKRGDLAPKAGTLWGDRNSKEATGFLLKPTDGFQSPPHIHNVSYRGIVISGLIHNDDPNATEMWMPAGSFWTQPKGEVHITAAKGTNTFAYIEIDEGPYLVLPEHEHFDNGERPVNVDHTNMVWVNANEIKWIEQPQNGSSTHTPQVAFLWGNRSSGELNGTLLKLPKGFKGNIKSTEANLRAVVISGQVQYQIPEDKTYKTLEAGSYFGSSSNMENKIVTSNTQETIIYIRTQGVFEITHD